VPLAQTSDFNAAIAAAEANAECAAAVAALDPQSTIVVIGAGLSHPAFPLWPQLAVEVCRACAYRTSTATAHPKTFQAARDKNPTAYAEFLKHRFSAPIVQIRLSLLYLMRLKFRAYLTTNFDNSIVSAAECVHDRSVGVYVYPEHPDPENLDQQNVVFIHGRCAELFNKDADNLVLHYQAYRRAYVDPPVPLARFFRGIFARYNCLFVGTSLKDPPVVYLLQNLAHDEKPVGKTRVLLLASKAFAANTMEQFEMSRGLESTDAQKWKSEQSIDVLRYAPLTTDHDGLESVFRSVCEIRRSLSSSQPLATSGVPASVLEV
jgi:hypothetical protein